MENPEKIWLGSRALLIGAILWSLSVFVHYFPLPQAIDLSFLRVLSQDLGSSQPDQFFGTWIWFLKNLLGAALLWAVFRMLGSRGLRWIGVAARPGAMILLVETALGMLTLGLFWVALGFNGLWQEGFLKFSLVVLSLLALVDLRQKEEGSSPLAWAMEKGTKRLVFLGGLFGALSLGMAAAPDVFYDGLVYHLSTLRFWLDQHGLVDLPANLYSYYPFGGETILLNGFLIGGSEGAKLVNALSFLMTGAVAAFWVREKGGDWAGAATWAMVLAVPLFNATVWTSQVDILLALFFLLFVLSLGRFAKGEGAGWALVAGLFAGTDLSIKYTAGLGLFLAVGLLGVLGPHGVLSRKKGLLILGGSLSLVLFSPWFLRTLIFCGDPFYPYPFFGLGKSLPPDHLTNLLLDHEAVWLTHPSFGEWLQRFLGRDLDKTIAPLVLGLLPLLVFWKRIEPIAQVLWVLGGAWLVSGFALSHQPRLVIPAFLLLLAAAGMTLGVLPTQGWKRWAAVLLWVFGAFSFLSLGRLAFHYYRVDRLWTGAESREEYLIQSPQTASYYPLTRSAGRLVPPGKRLLIVGDARGLYYPGQVLTNSAFDVQVPELLASQDPNGIRRTLREMGVDGWVIPGEEGTRLFGDRFPYSASGKGTGSWGPFRRKWLRPLYVEGKNAIFLLKDNPVSKNLEPQSPPRNTK